MCFNISQIKALEYLESRFDAVFVKPELYKPIYHTSAFTIPSFPVIIDENISEIHLFQWGLIPFWVKDEANANKIRLKTFNAKAETIFEKPSFRSSIISKRCLVIVDGFYEWRHEGGKKYPYYISRADTEAFAMAGIWESWENKSTGEILRTFSIITTEANPLLAKIHNTKKRMPVILKQDDEGKWLGTELNTDEIKSLLKPYDKDDLEAHPVSKLITAKGKNKNVPEVMDKFDYPELKQLVKKS
jgi:putative SOS response-associated peptidase YedK